jgi:hypothetical protein
MEKLNTHLSMRQKKSNRMNEGKEYSKNDFLIFSGVNDGD